MPFAILLKSVNPLRPAPKLTDFPGLIRSTPAMFHDLLTRRYRKWPAGTLVGGLLGLIYLLNPLDFIPDALPGIGVIDDTLMVGVFLAFLSRDVKKYLSWKQKNEIKTDSSQR
ncbi:MAG: DUF1232 domain-containing protein [Verrucomicrobia bacterium]|nr:DUF1232 domain-containing protein [Verrucomicrobiota bacterium]